MKTIGISRQALVAALFGAAAVGTMAVAPKVFSPEAGAQPITVQAPHNAPLSFADLIEQVEPAVVSVNVTTEREVGRLRDMDQFFEQFRGMPGFDEFLEQRRQEQEDQQDEPEVQEGRSLGSGFFISQDGYIVTNNHVVDGAKEIQVVLKDGRELDAELVGTDKQTDLAVLRVTEKGEYPFVHFGSAETMRKGDWVVALGNPFGLGGTATAGILSADGREIGPDSPYTDFLQIDASINRGNSGGPTFDLDGNVIGVNTAIFSPTGGSVGIGFAIPAELADEITQAIIKDGKVSRGWLGVSIQDLTEDMAEAQGIKNAEGAIIADVTNGSPAEKGGLERGDIILSVNDKKVTDATSTTRVVGSLIANTSNKFEIIRGGKPKTLKVTVGERPEDPYARTVPASSSAPADKPEKGTTVKDVGATFEQMDDELRSRLGLRSGESGLVVTHVDKGGVMDKAGLAEGMVILEVNNKPAASVEDFRKAIADARKSDRTKVLIAIRVGQITNYRTIDLSDAS